jgi:hypothetical protein
MLARRAAAAEEPRTEEVAERPGAERPAPEGA